MQIYLLRHGIADDAAAGMADADRALTPEGKKKVREIAPEQLGYTEELLTTKALLPQSSPQAAWDEIRLHKDVESILLVGHEPLFSSLGAYLLGAKEVLIDFKKGAILCLEISHFGPQPRGILKWFLTAKLVEAST
jgi:phosphohistidine phosphatase